MKNVLIIRFSSLGDVILATSVVDAVHRSCPECRQVFVVKEEYSGVLENNPHLDSVIGLGAGERGLGRLVSFGRSLRKEGFDLVLDLQGGPRGRVLTAAVGASRSARPRSHRLRRMMMAARPGRWRVPLPHVVERYLECLRPWVAGGVPEGRPEVYLTREERAHALDVTDKVEGTGLVALSPGAKWPAKQWPEQHFARLGGALVEEGLGVLLLGASYERPLLERVASGISQGGSVMVVAAGLRPLASLFSISSAAVCNDSGLMHLSAAVDTPTIGIFGPTAPHFGFEPFGRRHRSLWLGLDCSPCSLHGGKPCRISEKAPCMHLLDPKEVANSVRGLVEQASAEGGAGAVTGTKNKT